MTSFPTSPPSPAPWVVAVVDDDASVASALQQWLGMLAIPAVVFHEGASLLRALEPGEGGALAVSGMGLLRAAVIDLNLPGMNGFEVALRLQAMAPGLRIVVITAANSDSLRMFGGVPKGVHCLDKPFLLEQIEALLLGPSPALAQLDQLKERTHAQPGCAFAAAQQGDISAAPLAGATKP